MGKKYGSTFAEYLAERKRKKVGKRTKRKYAPGGGPAVGQGGIGAVGGASGESIIPKGSLLREMHYSPFAYSQTTNALTQAGTLGMEPSEEAPEQQETELNDGPTRRRTHRRECTRCGRRMAKRDRYCPRCGEMHPLYRTAAEEQERGVTGEEDRAEEPKETEDELDQEGVAPDDSEDLEDSGEAEEPEEDEFGDEADMGMDEEPEDPDKQGIIRTVGSAHLVYKRETPGGDFEELWIYNIDTNLHDELKVRRDILAGTDIPEGKVRSDDGSQSYSVATLGNAQILHIRGLPN